MYAALDRTAEFRSLTGQRPPRAARRTNLHVALDALRDGTLPAEQARRVVLAELEHARHTARNEQARQHWCEVERMFGSRRAPPTRVGELSRLHADIEVLGQLYEVVTTMLAQQSTYIGTLERNAHAITTRIDASATELSDAAPRIYRTWRRPLRSFGLRMRCALTVALILYLAAIVFATL